MKFLILTQLIGMFFSGGNDTLTLNDCYQMVEKNYPLSKQPAIYEAISKEKTNNLRVNFLPQISLKGQVTYQSEVTKLELNTPLINPPVMNKDRYQITFDIKQLIYDGGTTDIQKELEYHQLSVARQKVNVELFALKEKINDLYFSILILQKKKESYCLLMEDIQNRLKEMDSKIKNGVMPASNAYILDAQILQIQGDIKSTESDINSYKRMLFQLIGKDIDTSITFSLPEVSHDNSFSDTTLNRPEFKLFNLQQQYIIYNNKLLSTKNIPKISLFGQAGVGRPGLNMLDNSFQPFYLIGLNVLWNPIDWNSANYEEQINKLNSDLIETQKEVFNKNIRITLEKYESDINKYEELIQKDDEIISKRRNIVDVTISQLENGLITSTVYLTELINYNQALLMKEIHIIQLTQAKINYITAKGN